jgi:acyl transferase domain-containing protein/NADPH:quinone reductase-like Zn-dependent oxidoreductase
VAAIGKVFAPERDTSLLIGSVKPNLGHSESASGITGVIKCVLALEHSLIPPTIGVENLNPNIDFESARVEIVTEVIPWPKQSLKRASVSSFGYGGANGHCILDHPENYAHDSSGEIDNGYHTPQLTPKSSNINLSSGIQPHNGHYAEQMNVRSLTILPFSGQHETSLRDNMIAIKSAITEDTLSDIAYTLARRSKFHVKSYCIVDSRQVGESLSLNGEESHVSHNSSNPRLGFVFTGQGAQWQDMARSLFAFAAFKASIAAQDQSLKLLSFSPAWTITSILSGDSELSVQDSNISQTVCTALQIGLIDLLREWNILAHAVVGHSSGEIAAAYAAGYLSRSQAIVTAYCRGMSLARNLTEGVMMALGLSENASLELLDGRENNIKIAAINSPSSVTLSGDLIPMTQLYEQVRAQGTFARLLHTGGNAYHSHHMKEVGEFYESRLTQALEELVTSKRDDEGSCDLLARRHWISTVTPWKVMENQSVTPNYWRRNLESPVQFSQAVENLMRGKDSTVDLLIEVGPHSALQGPLRQILEDFVARKDLKIPEYTPTLTRFEDGERSLLKTCGKLYCWGYPVDLITINSSERMTNGKIEYTHGSVCTNLPSYRYNYGPILCHETRIGREIRERRFLRHDLLGVVQAGGSKHRPTWRNVLRLKDIPWLNDHKLLPHAVLPGSGYVCLAIEAIKQHLYDQQIMSTTHCFRLRNVSISSAMRIPDNDSGLEIMFSIQVSSTSSKWYEFKLSSVSDDGGLWTEHASGLISMSHATASSMKWLDEDMNPRYIEAGEWYSHFTEAGLGYGPSFQGLWDLNSDPYRNIARARIGLATTDQYFTQGPESPYVIHPASLDLCHQLALIACHGGQTGRFRNAFVPVHIDEITVWPESGQHEKWGQGIATGELKGLRGAHADVQLFSQSGDPRVEITNLKCVAYHGGQQVSKPGVHEYTRLAWKPDISSLSKLQAKSLFPAVALSTSMKDTFGKLEELAICMIVELDAAYGAQAVSGLTLQRFMRWVQRSAVIDHPRAQVARSMLNTQRQNIIERICEELPEIIDVQIAKRIFDSMGDILNDTKTGVEVALQDNMLNDVYTTALGISAAYPQLENLLDLLGHRNPSLRILEVGAGTGAATAVTLHILSPMGLPKRFKSYTFTDISSAFLASAQARFSQYADMEYKLLDLNRPAEHQDIMSQFDLIIASECLHAAENVLESLQMLRKLLKPEGHLIMLETTRPSLGHNLIYGTFPGWWSEDSSKDTPFLSLGDWHQALKASGFSGVDIELADYEAPFEIVSTILSTAVEDRSHSTDTEKHVHIVHSKEKKPCHEAIGLKLQDQGLIPIFHSDDGSDIPQGRRVILCEETTSEALARATETHFNRIKRIVRNADSVLWLTVGDILRGGNAMSAVTTGLVRMLTTEMPEARHGVFHLERELDLCSDVEIISEIVRRESRIHDNDFEREFSVKDGIVHIPRLLFDEDLNKRYRDLHLYSEEPTQLRIQENGPVVADFSKPGLISSLFFRQDDTAFEEIPQDFIEVQVFSVGLNWKDLAVCTGKIDMNSFSSECSGKIIRIGSAVQNLQVGDRVYAIVWGKFGNIIRLPAKMAQRMRPNDSYEEMGGVSLVFCTAVYALNHIARLQKGESILIQGATGGVGLAALQLARRAGAQIFATAGNSVKTDFLVEECGLESSHVFSSRNERDLQRMARCNEGRGFDVILSTSTGSMMHETWRHIAPRGRFIDVGRLDVQDHATLAMEVFARNAVFASFDLSVMVRQDMSFCARLVPLHSAANVGVSDNT